MDLKLFKSWTETPRPVSSQRSGLADVFLWTYDHSTVLDGDVAPSELATLWTGRRPPVDLKSQRDDVTSTFKITTYNRYLRRPIKALRGLKRNEIKHILSYEVIITRQRPQKR